MKFLWEPARRSRVNAAPPVGWPGFGTTFPSPGNTGERGHHENVLKCRGWNSPQAAAHLLVKLLVGALRQMNIRFALSRGESRESPCAEVSPAL